jgi:hypothetical protein
VRHGSYCSETDRRRELAASLLAQQVADAFANTHVGVINHPCGAVAMTLGAAS